MSAKISSKRKVLKSTDNKIKTSKTKTTKSKISKNKNLGPTDTSFILTGISAVKIVLSQYVKNRKKIEEFEENDGGSLPLTLVSPEDEDLSITDILYEKSKLAYYFLDSHKSQIKLWPNMLDIALAGPLPESTTKSCWWDRHNFQNKPIGCPLKYIPPSKQGEKETYETEGYFCSFPCCKAYIISHKSEMKYKESLTLLTMLFMSFYGKPQYIPTAPTWKILKDYCGHLTVREYRASFGRLEYQETVNVKKVQMLTSPQYIEEKRSKTMKKNVN